MVVNRRFASDHGNEWIKRNDQYKDDWKKVKTKTKKIKKKENHFVRSWIVIKRRGKYGKLHSTSWFELVPLASKVLCPVAVARHHPHDHLSHHRLHYYYYQAWSCNLGKNQKPNCSLDLHQKIRWQHPYTPLF